MTEIDLTTLTVRRLIALHRSSLRELYNRGIVRTMNSPQGDYAERLVAIVYAGTLADNSEKSWDVLTADGHRIQVKSRVLRDDQHVSAHQTSAFRSWEFDLAVVVLFADEDLSVTRAAEFDVVTIRDHARFVKHVNGWRIVATSQFMDLGRDITEEAQSAALAL